MKISLSWISGNANADFKNELRLEPMLRILEKSDYKNQVQSWAKKDAGQIYELLYYGLRSFDTNEGMKYLARRC